MYYLLHIICVERAPVGLPYYEQECTYVCMCVYIYIYIIIVIVIVIVICIVIARRMVIAIFEPSIRVPERESDRREARVTYIYIYIYIHMYIHIVLLVHIEIHIYYYHHLYDYTVKHEMFGNRFELRFSGDALRPQQMTVCMHCQDIALMCRTYERPPMSHRRHGNCNSVSAM